MTQNTSYKIQDNKTHCKVIGFVPGADAMIVQNAGLLSSGDHCARYAVIEARTTIEGRNFLIRDICRLDVHTGEVIDRKIKINIDNEIWIRARPEGGTRIVFADIIHGDDDNTYAIGEMPEFYADWYLKAVNHLLSILPESKVAIESAKLLDLNCCDLVPDYALVLDKARAETPQPEISRAENVRGNVRG